MSHGKDGRLEPLSGFGRDRISELARERAERVDGRTSALRFYLEGALHVTAAFGWLLAFVSAAVFLLTPQFSIPVLESATVVAVGVAVGTVARALARRVANPSAK
ncbi:hypothetical protein ACFQGT_20085 [Natrialbaceae archaeon GCM10025810]|uniref:hypothetical protein n=1 Tax=Halovalidus salilacus TaxID=3075124 RepID=UPI0036209E93